MSTLDVKTKLRREGGLGTGPMVCCNILSFRTLHEKKYGSPLSMNDQLVSKLTLISCTILAFSYGTIWFQGGFESDKTDVSDFQIELPNESLRELGILVANSSSAVNVPQDNSFVPTVPDWWNNGPKLEIKNCVTRNKNSRCSEDAQIQKIFKFWPKRIPESDYLKALKSVKLQTDQESDE